MEQLQRAFGMLFASIVITNVMSVTSTFAFAIKPTATAVIHGFVWIINNHHAFDVPKVPIVPIAPLAATCV